MSVVDGIILVGMMVAGVCLVLAGCLVLIERGDGKTRFVVVQTSKGRRLMRRSKWESSPETLLIQKLMEYLATGGSVALPNGDRDYDDWGFDECFQEDAIWGDVDMRGHRAWISGYRSSKEQYGLGRHG